MGLNSQKKSVLKNILQYDLIFRLSDVFTEGAACLTELASCFCITLIFVKAPSSR